MRKLRREEYDLIVFLLKDKPEFMHLINGLSEHMVEEMNDEGMGSLHFVSNDPKKRKHDDTAAQITLLDADNTPVLFSVDIDQDGNIYELDVFKADSSPLIKFPTPPYDPLD